MARLSVQIDHVATLRQARRSTQPDPVHAAVLAGLGGAHGITVHLRGDRRHAQDRDAELLRQTMKAPLSLKLAATQEMIRTALTVKPELATFVPERRDEITTEGGVDVVLNSVQLKPLVKAVQDGGIRVSLFVDPDLEQVREAHKLAAEIIEINTASYGDAATAKARDGALRKIIDAVRLGAKLGLEVHAGHGLDYGNVRLVAALPEVATVHVGHAIVARAVLVGMERAVREMVLAMREA